MDESQKIYTKTGDQGQTSLIGGERVAKDHPRIDAYGTLDELNSFLGLAHDYLHDEAIKKDIQSIQDCVFVMESHLAAASEEAKAYLPGIDAQIISMMETRIDTMDSAMPPLRRFILPGGNLAGSAFHVARTVCRRAERLVITLSRNEAIDPLILKILNRLSDYLFVMARYVAFIAGSQTQQWVPKA
jgi:cob(I)alamin adenosyltransferase